MSIFYTHSRFITLDGDGKVWYIWMQERTWTNGSEQNTGKTSFIYPKNNREENALWLVSHSSTYRKPTRAV
jgi:hypothetical protein